MLWALGIVVSAGIFIMGVGRTIIAMLSVDAVGRLQYTLLCRRQLITSPFASEPDENPLPPAAATLPLMSH